MATRDSTQALFPKPRQLTRGRGAFALEHGLPIVLAAQSDERDFESARSLQHRIEERTGLRLAIEFHGDGANVSPRIELSRRPGDGEAYRVAIDQTLVRVEASGGPGLRWAIESLVQLIETGARGARLMACQIDDRPDYKKRGFMLDVSRGKVPTQDELEDLVDRLASAKMNVLMLYVEHSFAFRHHPDLSAGTSALTAQAIRELDHYAWQRHVELVPNLQSLGHMERLLVQSRYAELAESDAKWTLAPSHRGSYALLRELYDEYLPHFRSPLFHANCDEPWDLGTGQSAQRARALGPGGLFAQHAREVQKLAARHGRQTMIWADYVHSHPERQDALPKDLVLCDWHYEAEGPYERLAALRQHGARFWVCPGTSSWNALFPRVANAHTNITRYADAGRRYGAEGLLLTDWGDFGHYNLLGNSWYALAWAAQQAWSGEETRARFERAFARAWFGEGSEEAGRLYRELGACHDVGYRLLNASPIAFLFFDDLGSGVFTRGTKPRVLEATRNKLATVCEALASARWPDDEGSLEELDYAARASRFAIDKAIAGERYLRWRAGTIPLDARARRRLATAFTALARQQSALLRELRELWLERNEVSNFEVNENRTKRSIESLRRAAGELRRNRPAPVPEPHPGFDPKTVLHTLRRETGWPPGPRA